MHKAHKHKAYMQQNSWYGTTGDTVGEEEAAISCVNPNHILRYESTLHVDDSLVLTNLPGPKRKKCVHGQKVFSQTPMQEKAMQKKVHHDVCKHGKQCT